MAIFDGSELYLVWSEHRPVQEVQRSFITTLALLERMIAEALRVDLDTIEVVEFEPPENRMVLAQVICNNGYESDETWDMEINLATGEVRKE